MPSASGVPERELLQLLLDWIPLSLRAGDVAEFLSQALPALRSAMHADSVAWVRNDQGHWQVELRTGSARPELPDELLAKAADEEHTVRNEHWLVVPVLDASATQLLVIGHRAIDTIEAWVPFVASAISSLRQMVAQRNEQVSSGASQEVHGTADAKDRRSEVPLLGECSAMEALRKRIARIAASELTVLVHGENGTGKEIVSRLVHEQSPRSSGPWLAVNCAALTDSLLESELFGHERGAFTDAKDSRAGKFELASGGTLFLDEIGEMSPRAQSQLLRVLEEKAVVRVGGSEPIPVDTRLVAATNRDLAAMVKAETFRRDLFFRLNVVTLELPPLRERGEDIRLLAENFLAQAALQRGRPLPRLTNAAVLALHAHPWPGNVRELRNLMERVAFLYDDELVDAGHLGLSNDSTAIPYSVDGGATLAEATRQFQIAYIEHQMRAGMGSMTVTAQRLGMHRTNLYRKMKQLGMTPPG